MRCANVSAFVVLLLVGISEAANSVSLVIPDFDPQPLSAEIVGVGADGETTYLLLPGQPTGTWISQPAAFTGTATLVEDASHVVFEYANSALSVTVAESCTLASGIADCLVAVAGQTTATAQETVTPLLVQAGSSVSSFEPTSFVSSSVSTLTTPVPGSSTSKSSTSALPTSTASSGGVGVRPAIGILLVGVVAISAVLV